MQEEYYIGVFTKLYLGVVWRRQEEYYKGVLEEACGKSNVWRLELDTI